MTLWAWEVMFGELDHLHGRSFGFTSGGQMTLLPPGAREGDHVCLLYGIRLPFLLRQDVDGYCQVIGACYVHQHFNWDAFESRAGWEQLQLITFRWIRCLRYRLVLISQADSLFSRQDIEYEVSNFNVQNSQTAMKSPSPFRIH